MSGKFEGESTVIRPRGAGAPQAPVLRLGNDAGKRPPRGSDPGGSTGGPFDRRPGGRPGRTPPPPSADSWDRGLFGGKGVPPLVSAALPLLNLAGRLRVVSAQPNLDALRGKVIQSVKLFDQTALAGGVPPERVRAAHYALCATIDDIILNAPWGTYSVWARQSMVSTFHGDVTGGERFFDLLAHLHKDPGTNRDVLLLMYYCLSIGFEGRMRIHPQGHLEVGRIREGLYRTLRDETERELSPEWRGVDARHRPLSTPLILWTTAAVAAFLLVATYVALSTWLDRRSDRTLTALIQAPPQGVPSLRRADTPKTASAGTNHESSTAILRKALAPEIKQGVCDVGDSDGGSRISLKNEGLFEVGKADVQPTFAILLDKIGRLLHGQAAQVVVIGYTDNTPIHTAKFPSNYYLSVGRADAVAKILGRYVDPLRIRSEGRGAADPVATNATPEGREKNRRTEIMVYDAKTPGTTTGTSGALTPPSSTPAAPPTEPSP